MIEARSGLVIKYSYLWAREADRGEDAGRKIRPACVQLLIGATSALLFPITSQPPGREQHALEIPEIEARRVGLRTPAWIIVDEWNEDDLATSASVADPRPLGALSKAFVLRIREEATAAIKARRYRSIARR